jgi:hypothetical protein
MVPKPARRHVWPQHGRRPLPHSRRVRSAPSQPPARHSRACLSQVLTFFTDVSVRVPPIAQRLEGSAPPIILLPHEPAPHPQSPAVPLLSTGQALAPATPLETEVSIELPLARWDDEQERPSGGRGAAPRAAAASPAPQQGPQGGGAGLDRRALVLVMEYCDAGSLSDAIRQGAFREKVKGERGLAGAFQRQRPRASAGWAWRGEQLACGCGQPARWSGASGGVGEARGLSSCCVPGPQEDSAPPRPRGPPCTSRCSR